MPASTIDMFFACTLIVSVAIISTAFLAGTMQTQIGSMQDLNQESYLQGIADHIVSSYGTPSEWGSTQNPPESLGLSATTSNRPFTLDADKISRLNTQNLYTLSYYEALSAARISNIAFGVSVSQMLSIDVALVSNITVDSTVSYTFEVSVYQDAGPVQATLHCYILASSFLTNVSNVTASSGIGSVNVAVPNSAAGPTVFVVFAQASFDDKLCAFTVYSFAHLSESPQPNRTFLGLSPLNNTLTLQQNYPATTVSKVYALTYDYSANLNSTSTSTYAIPAFVDKSPVVMVVQGANDTVSFNEWVVYPQIPLTFGGDFSNSSANVFVYIVTIDEVLYKLTLRFGDVVN